MGRFDLLRNLFGIYELNRRRWPKLCLARNGRIIV
jgi:hypothetical protein